MLNDGEWRANWNDAVIENEDFVDAVSSLKSDEDPIICGLAERRRTRLFQWQLWNF